jgi:hypothetical protein
LQTVDIEIWRQWTLPNWQQHTLATLVLKDKSPEANDFAAYTAMVVRERNFVNACTTARKKYVYAPAKHRSG